MTTHLSATTFRKPVSSPFVVPNMFVVEEVGKLVSGLQMQTTVMETDAALFIPPSIILCLRKEAV